MPPWLKSGIVIMTVCIAMPVWAAVVIVELVRSQQVTTETLAIPLGLLSAAGVAWGTGRIEIRRKKDDDKGEPPDAAA